MTATRLVRRLGLDGNPLRRRTDKVAACFAGLLVAVFLISAPWLSVAAVGWAGHAGATGQRAQPGRQVSAARPHAAPIPRAFVGGVFGYSRVPPSADAGSPAGAARSHRMVLAREVAAALVATVALGIVLLCLAWAGRWVLDRRRLAGWEAAWAAVGPQWTKRFRSRG